MLFPTYPAVIFKRLNHKYNRDTNHIAPKDTSRVLGSCSARQGTFRGEPGAHRWEALQGLREAAT